MRGACKGEFVKSTTTAVTLILAVSPALAEEPILADEPQRIDTIIVTATRTEIPLRDATVPVEVITREEIELSQAGDVAELLRFEAGIDLGRNGGPGQATSVFLRGAESNHTLVLIDGVRINPGTIGGAALQNIAPKMIERVEIVKGARSALFGTDAIGGVINIITGRADEAYGSASLGGGSFASRSAYFSLGGAGKSGDFGIGINLNKSDGFPTRRTSDIDRGYDNTTINLHGSLTFGDTRVSLRHWSATGSSEYLDFFESPLDQDFENRSTALEVRTAFSKSLDSRLIAAYTTDDIAQNQSRDFVESSRLSFDWQLTWTGNEHVIAAGLYAVDEDAASFSFGTGFDENTTSNAVFLQDQWSHKRHRTLIAVRLTDHETFGSETTWNVEYAFDFDADWTVQASLGRAFRAPDASDRFGFGGNPALSPEISREAQLGLRFRPADHHTLSLELYRNDIDDLIEFDLATFQLRNIAKAEIRGAELGWDYRGDSFTVRASVVRQKADNALDDVRLLRRAEKSATVRIIKDIGPHKLGLTVLASGDREDFGSVRLPGYTLVNLTGQIVFADNWRLNLRIENLFDRDYQTADGFRTQALSGFAELTYTWR